VSTSYRQFTSTFELPSDTSSAGGSVETGTGSGKSFLDNKAAVGSTFGIIGLIGVAIIIGAIFFAMKKARQRKDDDEYFEKLPANNGHGASNSNLDGDNEYELGPSATDLTAPANDRAYMSRDVHYGATDQLPDHLPNPYANYNGLEYPPDRGSVVEPPASYAPGTAYAAAMARQGPYHYGGQVQGPNTAPNHPFSDANYRRY